MNMNNYPDFGKSVERYFQKYLVKERGASKHTIKSYADTFSQMLDFLQQKIGITADTIQFDIFNRDLICNFLTWLENERHNSISTRNIRLFVLRSFFTYMIYVDPTHIDQWKSICSIKKKRCDSKPPNYLTIEGIKAILSEIDVSTIRGRRDLTMLSLLYNSGARVQELIDLTPDSIRMEKPYCIILHGKGDKIRQVPLENSIINLVKRYMEENRLAITDKQSHPLFFNSRHEKFTPMGITYLLKKYVGLAKAKFPNLIPDRISPHCFRHSKAMHLLMAGCPLIYIRDVLGHVSISTTEVYAKTDSACKRQALENGYSEIGLTTPELASWERSPKLREYLKSLGENK